MDGRARALAALALCLLLLGCTRPAEAPPAVGTLSVGGHEYRRDGASLVQVDRGDGVVRLGVVCDAHGDAAAAGALAPKLAAEGVDAILVCGDSCDLRDPGPDDAEMERTLEPLLATGLLVLVIPGNHESRPVYSAVMGMLAGRHPNLVDLAAMPLVELDGASIVALPGYHDPRFLAPSGFLLGDGDVERAVRLASSAPAPRLLLTHGPPLSSREGGVDVVAGGAHVGDARLADAFSRGGFAVHAFGHVHEAGGRAETPEGSPVPPGVEVPRILVNAAPASPWELFDGTRTTGQAVVVLLSNGTASYRVVAAS